MIRKLLAAFLAVIALAAPLAAHAVPVGTQPPVTAATSSQAQSQALVVQNGDSYTLGNQDGLGGSVTYSLSQTYGLQTVNGGIGGQTSNQIAMRQGAGATTLTFASNTIAVGTTNITAINGSAPAGTSGAANAAQPLSTQSFDTTLWMGGTICGVHGTLERTATGGPPSTAEVYTFWLDPGYSSTACAANSTFVSDYATYLGNPQIFWWGFNDMHLSGGGGGTQVETAVAAGIAALTSTNYACLGVTFTDSPTDYSGQTNHTAIAAVNSWEAANCGPGGSHYLNLHAFLQSLSSGSATDVYDVSQDIEPLSTRASPGGGTLPALTSSQTSFTVSTYTANSALAESPGAGFIVLVDSEAIQCFGISGSAPSYALSSCTRGAVGTTAASHAANAAFVFKDPTHFSSATYAQIATFLMANKSVWLGAYNNPITPATSGQFLNNGLIRHYGGPLTALGFANTVYNAPSILAIGQGAAYSTPSPALGAVLGGNSVYVGDGSGYYVATGFGNTYTGYDAGKGTPGYAFFNGNFNSLYGDMAGYRFTGASNSSVFGALALSTASSISGASVFGYEAGLNAGTSATNLTTFGELSCKTVTTATPVMCLGPGVGSTTLSTGANVLLIGLSSAVDAPAAATSNYMNIQNALIGGIAAPTISSGFGSSPSVANGGSTFAFTINVGTGGTASSGVVAMGATAPHGWACDVRDLTSNSASVTDVSATTTTTATFSNYSRTTGLSTAWAASDVLQAKCNAY